MSLRVCGIPEATALPSAGPAVRQSIHPDTLSTVRAMAQRFHRLQWQQKMHRVDLPPADPAVITRVCRLVDQTPFSGPPRVRVAQPNRGDGWEIHQRDRGLVADGTVRPIHVVIPAPLLKLFAGIRERQDPVGVQPGGAMAAALDEDFRVHKAMTFAKRTSP